MVKLNNLKKAKRLFFLFLKDTDVHTALAIILFGLLCFGLGIAFCSDHICNSLPNEHKAEKKVEQKKRTTHKPLVVKPTKAPLLKKKFVPKENPSLNKVKWAGYGLNLLLKEECGECKKICWETENDAGGVTCSMVAVNRRPDFFVKVLNQEFQNCKNRGIYAPPGNTDPFGAIKDYCYFLRQDIWKNYVQDFSGCSFSALLNLADSSVLHGKVTTIKLFQRSQGIKEDGVFGEESTKHCQKETFNKQAFLDTRIKYIKSLRDFKFFGKGWLNRVARIGKL